LRTKLQSPVTQLVPRPLQEYIPRLDSLSTAMRFLSSPTAGLPADKLQKVQALSGQLQQLQGKWQQAGAVQDFIKQREQLLSDQLDALKSKIANAGGGNSNMEIPRFTPNDQKTKSFLHRLEFGFNMQSQTSTVYLPTTTNFAATVGYRINNGATAGIGVSYAMGWGTGLDHIALSAQGVGVRNYIDIKAKGSIWITGGMEYNYIEPFTKLTDLKNPDVWQKSVLLGLTKKYKVGKQTGNVQLLYDFLAHSQSPQGAALKFRVGYTF
jgi:hypothetical protein